MATPHRATRTTPDTSRAHIYAPTEKTGWFNPTCTHGTTAWEGEMPRCETRGCLWRWWLRYGIPALLVLAAIIVVGLRIGPDLHCPEGWRAVGMDSCVRSM